MAAAENSKNASRSSRSPARRRSPLRHARHSALVKLVLSYVAALALPLALTLLYFYPLNVDRAQARITADEIRTLGQAQELIDSHLANVYRIVTDLSGSPILKDHYLEENNYNERRAVQEIRKFTSNNPFVQDAFLYLFNRDRLYSKTGTHSTGSFGSLVYIYPDWSHDSIIHDLQTVRTPTVRPSETVVSDIANAVKATYVTFLFPVPLRNDSPYGAILIHVRAEAITNLFTRADAQYPGNFLVVDDAGRVITALKEADYYVSDDFHAHLRSSDDGLTSTTISIDGDEYILNSLPSTTTDWNYISVLPVRSALSDVRSLQSRALFLFVAVVIIELILFGFFLRANYAPIRRLLAYVDEEIELDSESESIQEAMTEFETIQAALRHLLRTRANLSDRISANRMDARDVLLKKLIAGQFASRDQFGDHAGAVGVGLDFEHQAIASLKVTGYEKGDLVPILETVYLFEREYNSSSDFLRVYFAPDIRKNCLIAVMSSKERDFKAVRGMLLSLQDRVQDSRRATVTVGIGAFVNEFDNVQFSYNTAFYALDFASTKQKASITAYDEHLRHSSPFDGDVFSPVYNLKFAVLERNRKRTLECIERAVDIVSSESTSLFIIRAVFFEVIQFFIDIQETCEDSARRHAMSMQDILGDLTEHNVSQMVSTMRTHAKMIVRDFDEVSPDHELNDIEDVLRHVRNNFQEPNFSIKSVAETFGMSVSAFSYYFKKHAGENFSSYVGSLRLAKARDLLRESSCTTDQIAAMLNYSSASSFGRAFKKATGITPGEYRLRLEPSRSTEEVGLLAGPGML